MKIALIGVLIFSLCCLPLAAEQGRIQVIVGTAVVVTGGWTFLQGSGQPSGGSTSGPATVCMGTVSTCPMTVYSTTAGSIWVAMLITDANVHITSVTGGGGSWTLCPSSHCSNFLAGSGISIDLAYNLTGTTGTTGPITVNASGNSGSIFEIEFMEILPPTCGGNPCTVAFDGANALSNASCSTACTGAAPTVSGTDIVLNFPSAQNNALIFNPWSSPYLATNNGWGLGFDVTSGTAPTYNQGTTGYWQDTAISFKLSAGNYTAKPTKLYSIVQAPNSAPISCTPACDQITLPSTGSGDLLFVQIYGGSAASSYISSITWTGTNGGTWVIPAGCQKYAAGVAGSISCAYVLSSGSGGTKINITMTSNSTPLWAYVEVSRSSGSFALDAVASTSNTSSTSTAPGQTLTLSGTNADPDVIFQGLTETGTYAPFSQTLYYLPAYGGGGTGYETIGASAMLINTLNGSAPTWFTPQSGPSLVMGIAFK